MANLGLQNNNAGNLRDPKTGNFQVFTDPSQGYDALVKDLTIKKSGQSSHIKPGGSILDLANVWAPASDGNKPSDWANNVAKTVGVKPTDSWANIPTDQLAKGIQVAEGTSTPATLEKPQPQSEMSGGTKPLTDTLAQKVKAKYPQYADVPDDELTQKIIAKYPQYQSIADTGSNKKLKFEDVKGATPPPAQASDIPGVINQVQQGDLLGAGASAIRKYGNFVTGGGTETLGNSIGTLAGLLAEKAKNLPRGIAGQGQKWLDLGTDNSSTYDTSAPSPLDTTLAGLQTVGSASAIQGAGGVLGGLINGASKGSYLGSNIIKNTLQSSLEDSNFTGSLSGKVPQTIEMMSSADKVNTLTEALSKADPATKPIIEGAIKEAGSQILKEAGIGSFSDLNPAKAKLLGLGAGALKLLTHVGLDIAGMGVLRSLIK